MGTKFTLIHFEIALQVSPDGDRQVHGRLHLPPNRLHDELYDCLCRSRGIPELSWDVHQGEENQTVGT